MTDYLTQTNERTDIQPRRAYGSARHRIATVVGAAISATVAWTFYTQVSGVDLTIASGGKTQHIGVAAVIIAALVAGGAGWGLLAVLERRTRRPYRTWRVIAAIVVVLSLLGPLGATTGAAVGALASLHLIVATILIIGLPRGCASRS